MDRNEYKQKILNMLDDSETYVKIKKIQSKHLQKIFKNYSREGLYFHDGIKKLYYSDSVLS